ncbi:MAG TPA: ABC transporter permease [Rhizomicrobium sp.]|nr:ABC transporter permease [Rhizomicrobium sp.]
MSATLEDRSSRSAADPGPAIVRAMRRPGARVGAAGLLLLLAAIVVSLAWAPDAFRQIHSGHALSPPSLQSISARDEVGGAVAEAEVSASVQVEERRAAPARQTYEVCGTAAGRAQFLRSLERSPVMGSVSMTARPGSGCASLVLEASSLRFPFGSDDLGRDVLSRTLMGIGISLTVGLSAALIAISLGLVCGMVAGFFRGWLDFALMRVVDVVYSLPLLFIVILLAAMFGGSIAMTILVLGLLDWPDTARIIRGRTIALMEENYVVAAVTLGVARRRILVRHIMPNVLQLAFVQLTVAVPKLIILETSLSFLGFGVREPYTSIGLLILQGTGNIEGAPWQVLFPVLFLIASLLALEAVSDSLRDETDLRP